MKVTDEGIEIDFNDVTLKKAYFPISLTSLCNLIFVKYLSLKYKSKLYLPLSY